MKLASQLFIAGGGVLTRWVAFGLLCAGSAYLLWPSYEALFQRDVWDWNPALQAAIQVVLGFFIVYGCNGLACSISAILFARLHEKAFGKFGT
jgi:hypothetical protein